MQRKNILHSQMNKAFLKTRKKKSCLNIQDLPHTSRINWKSKLVQIISRLAYTQGSSPSIYFQVRYPTSESLNYNIRKILWSCNLQNPVFSGQSNLMLYLRDMSEFIFDHHCIKLPGIKWESCYIKTKLFIINHAQAVGMASCHTNQG